MKTRFAPSPTGLMHFGSLRTAIFNYLFAKKEHGSMLLRIEDTDLERSNTEYYHSLLEDLNWAGITWQEGPYKQSERATVYAKYYQQLEKTSNVYPCFCTEEELAISRKVQLANGMPPRYMGTCQHLTNEVIQAKLAAGLQPTLRFRVPPDQTIEFLDLVKGAQSFKSNDLGDFIIRRQDGSASFMLCNAIDDAEMGITHALRGDDHLTNTPRQMLILQALQLPIPQYGHFPMITGDDGAKLSKRNGSESVQLLREQGYVPLAVVNYLARLGHYYENNKFMSIEELADNFAVPHINTSPARHDVAHLKHWQKESMLALTSIPEKFLQLIIKDVQDIVPADHHLTFAELILPNVLLPKEAKMWAEALFGTTLTIGDSERTILHQAGAKFFAAACNTLQQHPDASLTDVLAAITAATNAKGKALFMPVRIALTGIEHGPELAKILALMGSDRAIERFKQAMKND